MVAQEGMTSNRSTCSKGVLVPRTETLWPKMQFQEITTAVYRLGRRRNANRKMRVNTAKATGVVDRFRAVTTIPTELLCPGLSSPCGGSRLLKTCHISSLSDEAPTVYNCLGFRFDPTQNTVSESTVNRWFSADANPIFTYPTGATMVFAAF